MPFSTSEESSHPGGAAFGDAKPVAYRLVFDKLTDHLQVARPYGRHLVRCKAIHEEAGPVCLAPTTNIDVLNERIRMTASLYRRRSRQLGAHGAARSPSRDCAVHLNVLDVSVGKAPTRRAIKARRRASKIAGEVAFGFACSKSPAMQPPPGGRRHPRLLAESDPEGTLVGEANAGGNGR